jgi:two-component system chemotaxis sensor kinase CheA
LIIGTDKTTEIENMEKFKKEWTFSQMMMRIVSNRYSLNKVIKDSLGMLAQSMEVLGSNKLFPIKDVQRYIHTIKGSYSYFHIEDITKMSHDLESFLEPYFHQEKCADDLKMQILEKIMAIQIAIESYIDKYDEIIQYKTSNSHRTIPVERINTFAKALSLKSQGLYNIFHDYFYFTEIQPFFQMYPSIVHDLGVKLNKNINFKLEGTECILPEGPWEELFGQFIHFVRNSADHGIEPESERIAAGKNPTGEIKFSFKRTATHLAITLSDDGRGIDWKKIAQKDPSVQNEKEAIQRIMMGGISSKDEVSDVSGRGVGVSAIFSMVGKWQGEITVDNRPSQGLRLNITVPLKKAETLKKVA